MQVVTTTQAATQLIPADNDAFRFIGRSEIVDIEGGKGVRFDVPGFEIRFRVTGTSTVRVLLQQKWTSEPPFLPSGCCCTGSKPHNFLVFVDGVPQETPLEGSECYRCTFDTSIHENDLDVQSYPVAHSLNPDEMHEIRIVKDSEADWNRCEPWPNWLVFHGIKVDAGRAAPAPPPPDQLRIEIVGGSTTSGYCNLCVAPWHAPTGDSVDQRSASLDLAWTGILCNNMTAACHITAWSGLGVISNLGTKQGRWHTPDLFRRGVQSDPASVWDFSSWVPNVLLIDLGSNDRSAWDDPNFVSTFLQFVSNYTSAYGPKTKVLVGCGMTETGYCPHIHSVVKQSQDNGLSVHYMDLSGMQDWACCGHPSPTAHAKIAAHVRNLVEHVLAGGGGDGEPNGPGPDGPPLDPDGGNNSPIPPHTTTPKPTLAPHPNGVGAHHHWKLIAVAASVAALAVVFVSVMCCVRRQKEKSENLLDADHP